MEVWTVTARLSSGFRLVGQRQGAHVHRPLPNLASFTIEALADRSSEHQLVARLELDGESPLHGAYVNDSVRDTLERLAALLSLSTGVRVNVHGYEARTPHPGRPNQFRSISGGETQQLNPPPIPADALFGVPMDDKMLRVIHWWSRGLPPGSPIDRLKSLHGAIDLLSGMLILDLPTRRETCRQCGVERELPTGLRERVKHILERAAVGPADVAAIWESRTSLAHGFNALSLADERNFARYCDILLAVLRDNISAQLQVRLPPIARKEIHGPSSFLDVTWHLPD